MSDLTTSEELIDPNKTNAGKSELAPLIELPIGDGDGEIGYIIVEVGGFNSGPEDFTILPDGTIMILDCVNKRILSFRDNKLTESFDISFCEDSFSSFTNTGDYLYLIGDERNVYRINKKDGQHNILYKGETNQIFKRVVVDGEDIIIIDFEYNCFLLKGEELKVLNPKFPVFEIEENYTDQTVKYGKIKWTLPPFKTVFPQDVLRYISPSFTDKYGNLYASESWWMTDPRTLKTIIESRIVKYDKNSNMVGYCIPDESVSVNYALNSVFVSEDGDVYKMLCKKDSVGIYKVTFGNKDESKFDFLK